MSQKLHHNTHIQVAKPYRLQWEETQDCYILLYPEGMVKINLTGGFILNLCCTEQKSVGETVEEIMRLFGPDPAIQQEVYDFLKVAYDSRWIEERSDEAGTALAIGRA